MAYSRIENSKRNIVGAFVNKGLTIILPFLVRTIIIDTLGEEYLGLSSLYTSILQVLSLTELGISNAIVFSMYKPIAQHDIKKVSGLYKLYRKLYLVIGIVMTGLGLILLPFLPMLISKDIPDSINVYALYIIYLLNTSLSYFMSGYKESILIADQRSDISTMIGTVSYTLMYIIQIVVLVLYKDYYLYAIIMVAATIFANIIRSIIVEKKYPEYKCVGEVDLQTKKEIKKNIVGLMLYKVSAIFRNSFDSIVISYFLGLVVLALYQNYYIVLSTIIGVCSMITTSITASVGNSIAIESVDKNYSDFKVLGYCYFWLNCFCTTCLLCLLQPFMRLWMGEGRLLSFNIVILFCIYFYTLRVADVCFLYRQAAGLWWKDKFRPVIEALMNLIFNIVLVRFFGVGGVLLSTIISICLVNIPMASKLLYTNYFQKPYLEYWKTIGFQSLVMCIIGALTYFLTALINDNGYISFFVKLLICIILPNMLIVIFTHRTSEYKHFKVILMNNIRKKKA